MASSAWIALSLTKHLGGKTFRSLLSHFDHNLEAILAADVAELRRVPGIGQKLAQGIQSINLQLTEEKLRLWDSQGVEVLGWDDWGYPPRLRSLDDAPPCLFVRGRLPDFAQAFALVGTRTPSQAARNMAMDIAAELASRGAVVVSGLALGIDTGAHMGALAVAGGTVSVLGSGILNLSIYPEQNRSLAQAIVDRGALICEVAPDAPVSTPGLVARNRIITGLSRAVVIVETEIDGGAMHAARFARMQGRPVFALESTAGGNRALLADGAQGLRPDDLSALFES